MAKLSHTDSRRMYSWWWDSHISPKNSKWLGQNLTDMDSKVKSMIKLIEVDEDSFARRAEMYYKKRPELMKMVEEFYRAYRALAERYDHATGVIRHAHRTMSEAFPNQDLMMMMADESPATSVSGADPRTPGSPYTMEEFTDESDNATRRKIPKPFNDSSAPVDRVRRGLNFDEGEDKVESVSSNGNNHVNELKSLKLERESDSKEIRALKEAIAKLEDEKEAGLVKYQQTLDQLSQLETEISKTREDFSMLRDHATKSDTEVAALKDALMTSEAEKESKLQDYQKCLEKISELQTTVSTAQYDTQKLTERANSTEKEAQSLKSEMDKLSVEKDAALDKYMQSLQTISDLENKLLLAEEDLSGFKERAEKAEGEVESLRQAISKLTEEKETAALQYQQCLETIYSLEQKLALANEEAKRLNGEIENGVSKLQGAEEQCLMLERSNQSLHAELESLMLKMGNQSQELTEKQKELGRLWACVQEERLRFVDAETAFQTLQHLHAKTQEELRSMSSELQNRAQLMKVAETQKQSLLDDVLKVKEENKQLDELNSSSALSIKNMQNEIASLTESKEKLEEEVELRLDQRNALQQEIYCLKEELKDLNKNHLSFLDQVHAVGLNPESVGSSVKELQDENSNLKETCQRESTDKAALLQKLEILEHLLEKNSLLETSLSDLNAELDAVRGKMEELEQSCQSLMKERSTILDEKATLMTKLQETSNNLEKLSENNSVLEKSLSDAHHQLEALKAKSKILEDSCQLLVNEKADLISDKDELTSQLDKSQTRLIDLEKLHRELEGRCECLENEKEATIQKVVELQMSLEAEKQEHASHIETREGRLTDVQSEMHVLQEEHQRRKTELDLVLDIAIASEIEIFVLRTTAQVLKENNLSLLANNQILIKKSSLSEKEISRLEQSKIEQQSEIISLSGHVNSLRAGTRQLLKVLSIAEDCASPDNVELDQVYANQLLNKLQQLNKSLCEAEEENLEHSIAPSVLLTWIKQLGVYSKNVEMEKDKIEHEFKAKTLHVLQLQSDASTLIATNEEFKSKLTEGDRNKEALVIQIENLNSKLTGMQDTCQDLEMEKLLSSEEKRSLTDRILHLEEKNNVLEENNYDLCDKVLALENLSLIFRCFAEEKLRMLRDLGDDWNKHNAMNAALIGKLSMSEGRFEDSKHENLDLKERLQKTEEEFNVQATIKDQLLIQIENLNSKLTGMQDTCQDLEMEKLLSSEEKRSLTDRILLLEEKNNVLEENNYDLCDKVLALENLSLIFRCFAEEKLRVLRDLGDDWNKLNATNAALIGKLSMSEGRFEDSKHENLDLKERLQKTEEEFNVQATIKDQLLIQIENLNSKLTGMQDTCQDLEMEKLLSSEEKRSLTDRILHLEEKNNVLEENNYDLCDKVLVLENLSLIFRCFAEEKLRVLRDLGDDWNKLNVMNAALIGKLSMSEGRFEDSKHENLDLKERLQRTEEEFNIQATIKDQLLIQIENLNLKLTDMQDACQDLQIEKLRNSEEKSSLMDRVLHLEGKNNLQEEEISDLCDKVFALENLSLIFRSFADEKHRVLRELGDDWNKLNEMNVALTGKLSMAEGRFEESKIENLHLKERLQKTEGEFKAVATVKDQFCIEIENGKKALHQMAQELQEAEEKISLAEKKKLELNKSVEDLRMQYNEVKTTRDLQESQILKLSTDNDHLSKENHCLREATQALESDLQVSQDNHDKRKLQVENLHLELENKTNKINELESGAASLFGQLQHSIISQVLYEQKFYELYDACLGYIDQNEGLETQLAAFVPEILLLKECISSLEDQTVMHIKSQNPENEELQGSEGNDNPPETILNEDKLPVVSQLHDLRVRLQAVVKAAAEIKEIMLQENIDLHSKLDESTRQIELLQSESGKHRRNRRPTSEITEEDNPLLTKDIVLDQVSDGSYRYSKKEAADVDNQIVELWETTDPDGTVGLSIGKSSKLPSPSTTKTTEFHRSRSTRKQKHAFGISDSLIGDDLSVDKLEISKRSTEGNKRKVLERLDSDVQKLTNLQITVQDLKRKLEVTEKSKRGKAVIECETLKRQLQEADMGIMKLFDLNGRLTKNIDDWSFSDSKSSFDFEGEDGAKRRRVLEQARRMSEKIGRIQLEVQKLQFVLLKLDDEKEGRSRMAEAKRRILLRDYLYGGGGGRTGQRKKSNFCACVQPSTVED